MVPIARAALAAGSSPALPPLLAAEALLCPLTGLAAWLVWRRIDVGLERKRAALRRWGWQLMLSALWPAAFYGARSPALAMLLLLLSLAAVVLTASHFRRLQPTAAALLLPYAVWLGVAAYFAVNRFWPGII